MGFKDPTFGGTFDVEDGRYQVKVKALEDAPEGEYGPGVKWIFSVATMENEVINDDRGFPAEFWQFSSDSLSARSKGGQWATALLGRELTTEDKGSQIAAELLGRKAVALIARNERDRCAIVKMTPLTAAAAPKNGTKAAPAKAAPPEEPPDSELAKDPEMQEVAAF